MIIIARSGLNCSMWYNDAHGVTRTYNVRAGTVAHGVEMIYTESAARTARAFYPHRSAMQQFRVTVLLKNWAERRDLVNWLSTYANYAVNPDIIQSQFPWMTVSVPSRGFAQIGVPLTGYEWGDHTASMMWTPVIVFESARSPGTADTPQVSSVINKWKSFASDPAVQYFYPFGTQLSGSKGPVTGSYNGSPQGFNNPGPTGSPPPPPPPPHKNPG